MQMRLVQN